MITSILALLFFIPWGGVIMMSPMMFATSSFSNSPKAIWTSFVFMAYPVVIFFALKLFGLNFFNTDPIYWIYGVLTVAICISVLVGIPGMLINLARGISNTGFFKAKNYVYYNGKKLPNADVNSFRIYAKNSEYANDVNHVYYEGKTIKDADPKTFICAGLKSGYFWTDNKFVYINGKAIAGSDSASFKELADHHWKDKFHVYYGNKALEDADPSTYITFSDSEHYSKDAKNVYYYSKKIPEADASSFVPTGKIPGYFWRDDKFIYIEGDAVASSDGFEQLQECYWKNKDHVFYGKEIINDALTESFMILDEVVGKDNLNVFVRNNIASNIGDVSSFSVIKLKDEIFGRDNKNIYAIFRNAQNPIQPIQNADISTFIPLERGYARDKNHVYNYRNKYSTVITLEGVDPDLFTVSYDPKTGADGKFGDLLFDSGEIIK